MTNKSIWKTAISVLLGTVLMASCAAEQTDVGTADNGIITISISEEGKQYAEEVIAQDGVKAGLCEEYFDLVMQGLSEREEQVFPDCEVQNKLDVLECAGSRVYTLTADDYRNIVLYIHGGAWTFEISPEHVTFCDELATRLHARVYMPLYPLAPQAGSEETYAMIESLYRELLQEGRSIYIMGDSAGANITLGLMYTIKAEGLGRPEKMVLISPCADMTFSNPEMLELDKIDPELNLYGCTQCAKQWAGEEHLTDPKNSALFADLTLYPDTLIFHGTNDILYPDTLLLYQKMKDSGVNVTLVSGEGLFHVFPIYPIPEQAESLKLIEKFVG